MGLAFDQVMRKPSRKQEKVVRVKQLKHDDPSSGDSSSEEVGEEEEEGEVWRERNALEDEQREHALRKQLETLKNLPKNSRYARHRIPVSTSREISNLLFFFFFFLFVSWVIK